MKKLGFLLFLVLGLTACGDDNNDPAPEQHVTCAISSPTEGATIQSKEKQLLTLVKYRMLLLKSETNKFQK